MKYSKHLTRRMRVHIVQKIKREEKQMPRPGSVFQRVLDARRSRRTLKELDAVLNAMRLIP